MNKKDSLKFAIVITLAFIIIIAVGAIVLNTQVDGMKTIEDSCESAGGEVIGWNCSYDCTLSCQYPNGTEINLTEELR